VFVYVSGLLHCVTALFLVFSAVLESSGLLCLSYSYGHYVRCCKSVISCLWVGLGGLTCGRNRLKIQQHESPRQTPTATTGLVYGCASLSTNSAREHDRK